MSGVIFLQISVAVVLLRDEIINKFFLEAGCKKQTSRIQVLANVNTKIYFFIDYD